jgi:hypothetical protein
MSHVTTSAFWLWPWWGQLILAVELLFAVFVAYLLYRLLGPGRIVRHYRLHIAKLEYEARVKARAASREADELWSSAPIRRSEHQLALRLCVDRTTGQVIPDRLLKAVTR